MKVLWRLTDSADLHANLLALQAGEEVAEHVEENCDVLLIAESGRAVVTVAGAAHELRPGRPLLVPKGMTRGIRAGERAGASYLTVHVRRPGLGIGSGAGRPRGQPPGTA